MDLKIEISGNKIEIEEVLGAKINDRGFQEMAEKNMTEKFGIPIRINYLNSSSGTYFGPETIYSVGLIRE